MNKSMEKEEGETKYLSNHNKEFNKELYRMKGGTRILAYEITVFLGSIPFITFLTWQARVLGLNKRHAFYITVYLCGDVMLFPWALRLGWINGWILSIMVLFLSSILWPKVLLNTTEDNVLIPKINVYAENIGNEEISEQIQVNVVEPENPVNMEEKILMLPIDELIDLGFKEKYAENFDQAALYFSRALSQDPIPDLAFSLIIDCYWLWNNLGERDYALTQLQIYVQKYLPLFNPVLRNQFDTWMVKEDLHIILE